jgi:hypothetical protein
MLGYGAYAPMKQGRELQSCSFAEYPCGLVSHSQFNPDPTAIPLAPSSALVTRDYLPAGVKKNRRVSKGTKLCATVASHSPPATRHCLYGASQSRA